MSYNQTGGDTDRIVYGLSGNILGDGANMFVCGWWHPTALTSGNNYWNAAAVYGAYVDGTTSEIRMKSNNVTTPGEWVTSGAGITTDKWWFIAWLCAFENTTVPGEWRCWIGDIDTAPIEQSISNPVVRSGNFTNANAFGVNSAAGSISWAGYIGWLYFLHAHSPARHSYSTIATSGVITNDEAANVYARWVLPSWIGRQNRDLFTVAGGDFFWSAHLDLTMLGTRAYSWLSSASLTSTPSLTLTGSAWDENQPPRQAPHNWLHQPALLRRI